MQQIDAPPPIPDPGGHIPVLQAKPVDPHGWGGAPRVVKYWAYPLSIVFLVTFSLLLISAACRAIAGGGNLPPEKVHLVLYYAFMWWTFNWLRRGLKKRRPLAWSLQLIFSILGLFAFPIGTLINSYILSQWSKSATKKWFGIK